MLTLIAVAAPDAQTKNTKYIIFLVLLFASLRAHRRKAHSHVKPCGGVVEYTIYLFLYIYLYSMYVYMKICSLYYCWLIEQSMRRAQYLFQYYKLYARLAGWLLATGDLCLLHCTMFSIRILYMRNKCIMLRRYIKSI